MSGPKLSAAELERLRQEQLERERQEALKRLMEAREQYGNVCNEVKKIKESALNLFNSINPSYKTNIEQDILRLINAINDKPILSSNYLDYNEATQNIKTNIKSWKDKLETVIKNAHDKSTNESNLMNRNDDFQRFSFDGLSFSGELEPVKIDFTCQYNEKQIEELLRKVKTHFEKRLKSKSEPRLISFDQKAINAILHISNSNDTLNNVKIKIQQIINEEENQIRLIKKFDDLYEEYAAISLMLGAEPKAKDCLTMDILVTELNELKEEYKRRDEMDYIADQINEVMIEQGYSFVSSKVLKKKNSGETEFSLYQDDGKSGVAVYTDESGAVMMRMTVLGEGGEITDADREFSYQSQIDFCSRHADLVEALSERGVYLKQKSYQAPDRQHTFKVDVSGQLDLSKSSTKKTVAKVDRRARRRGGNKKMRSM